MLTFKPSTCEAEAGRSLKLEASLGPKSLFQYKTFEGKSLRCQTCRYIFMTDMRDAFSISLNKPVKKSTKLNFTFFFLPDHFPFLPQNFIPI